MALVDEITIREGRPNDWPEVAQLRWDWVQEMGGDPPVVSREKFVSGFAGWARAHELSHSCVVTLRGNTLIGMAWLAIVPRVPSPRAPERASGDLQCVYIVPHERNGGLGARMVAAVLQLAEDRGLERLTVHSGSKAIPAYERVGFSASAKLLQVVLPRGSREG
jgi:GNAT superfamily N-acetyltransferase